MDNKLRIGIEFFFFLDAESNSSDDTLQFRLKVKCTRNNVTTDTTDPKILFKNHKGNGCLHLIE